MTAGGGEGELNRAGVIAFAGSLPLGSPVKPVCILAEVDGLDAGVPILAPSHDAPAIQLQEQSVVGGVGSQGANPNMPGSGSGHIKIELKSGVGRDRLHDDAGGRGQRGREWAPASAGGVFGFKGERTLALDGDGPCECVQAVINHRVIGGTTESEREPLVDVLEHETPAEPKLNTGGGSLSAGLAGLVVFVADDGLAVCAERQQPVGQFRKRGVIQVNQQEVGRLGHGIVELSVTVTTGGDEQVRPDGPGQADEFDLRLGRAEPRRLES